ncbi:hypothetical protein [Moorena producens]|uniref:hypothetical protein n=1 Tax=Moorena producens TaxID=1155739 RepID=UPI003C744FA0
MKNNLNKIKPKKLEPVEPNHKEVELVESDAPQTNLTKLKCTTNQPKTTPNLTKLKEGELESIMGGVVGGSAAAAAADLATWTIVLIGGLGQ